MTIQTKRATIPAVPLQSFLEQLADALPRLIEAASSPLVREHPVWGSVIPYHVPHYGTGISRGHCIRPDILYTSDGPKVCELDFVPSGRGYLLASLGPDEEAETLEVTPLMVTAELPPNLSVPASINPLFPPDPEISIGPLLDRIYFVPPEPAK